MDGWGKGNGQPDKEPCCTWELGLTGQIHTGQNTNIRQAAPEGHQPMELIWRDDQEHKWRWRMMKGKNSAAKRNWWQNESATVPNSNEWFQSKPTGEFTVGSHWRTCRMRKLELEIGEMKMREWSWLDMEKRIGTSSQIWHRTRQKDVLILYTELSSASEPSIRKLKTVPGDRHRKLWLS